MVVKTQKYYFQHLAENSIEYLLKSNTEQGNLSGHQIFQPFNFFYIFWMCFFVLVIYESTFIHSSSAIHFRICQKLNKQKINKKFREKCLSLCSSKKRFILDEKFQWNTSKFAIFYIRKFKVAFSVFHFMLLYFSP